MKKQHNGTVFRSVMLQNDPANQTASNKKRTAALSAVYRTPVSGVLILDNQDAVIRRLALLAPIRAVRSDAGLILRRDPASAR